jgi:Dolichyl-phosphate-mannose-protein mannosyltransferase
MAKTPHLSPLPLSEGRGGSPPSRYLLPSAKALATPCDYRATNLVIVIGILAVAARLILINQPYVDHWSWRQSDVAAIARNFLQNGFRFGYPQIDWAGNGPGYVGTEFPILPFIAALCYKFAGIHEWVGRIQAVILFAVSLPCFFLLVREIFGSTAAVWATFFYSFAPVNIFAGRSFMPDVPSLSFAIVGLYLLLRYVEHNESASFFVAAIALSLSFLIKITSIVTVVPLAYIVVGRLYQTPGVSQNGAAETRMISTGSSLERVNGSERVKRRTVVGAAAIFTAIALLPSVIWYWHAHQIAETFYPHHFFGAGGIRIESFSWYSHIAQQSLVSSLTPALSAMALVGLFVTRSRDRSYSRLFHWWLAAMIVFIILVGYGNRHRWYQLPLVPIAAAFAGAGCAFVGSRISSRFAAITSSIVLAVSFLILAFVCVRPFYESSAAQLRDAGLELKKLTPSDALIVAADMGDPTIFYYAERTGWHFLEENAIYNGNPDDSEQAIENLQRLRRRGTTHFVFTRNTFSWLQSYPEFAEYLLQNSTLIEATPEFRIYKLTVR